MRLLWISIVLALVIGLDPVTAFAGCQTWTVYEGGKMKVCTQCCYMGGNCTLTCY